MRIRGNDYLQNSLYVYCPNRNSISSLSKEDLRLTPTRLPGTLTKIVHFDADHVLGYLRIRPSYATCNINTGYLEGEIFGPTNAYFKRTDLHVLSNTQLLFR